ncbi:MAG: sulfatase-like hydrolase/transferase, partial [Planctomycetaceae bacterium]
MQTRTNAANAGRRAALKSTLVWLALLSIAVPVTRADESGDRPNFVLMMCDDLGWGDTGFNGNQVIRTPALDAMARSGMVFRRFYAASAVCSPTRGSVLTGRHPYRYGVTTANAGHLRAGERTIAELLRDLGYATGHFGKWHLGTLSRTVVESNRGGPRGSKHFAPPWINGFQVCFSTEAKLPTYDPMWKPRSGGGKRGWDFISDRSLAEAYGTHYWNQDARQVKDNLDGDDSRVIMDRVVPFVQQSVRERNPFFAVVWFHTPHLPVVAGPRHARMYADQDSHHRNYFGC